MSRFSLKARRKLITAPVSLVSLRGLTALALLLTSVARAQITKVELENLSAHFHAEYDQELASQNQSFFINRPPNPSMQDFWWNLKQRRASYASYTFTETKHREHYIFFFGGFAEMPGLTVDAAVLTLCHELGHGLGGPPHKDPVNREDPVSIEAVADDYAARVCLKRMLARIPPSTLKAPIEPSAFETIEKICLAKSPRDMEVCRRAMAAFEFDRTYFKTDPYILEDSSFLERDDHVATAVITASTHYPTAQCRIDTMLAGFFGEARPSCWWPLLPVK